MPGRFQSFVMTKLSTNNKKQKRAKKDANDKGLYRIDELEPLAIAKR